MPDVSTIECPIGREYAAITSEVHRKRDTARDDHHFNCYAQVGVELWRISQRHFEKCATCRTVEALQMQAILAAGVR